MSWSTVVELLEAERRLRAVEEALAEARRSLAELGEARRLLEKLGARRVFRLVAGRLMVELEPGEALRVIEEEREVLEARIARLERERKELAEKIVELRRRLSIA